MINLDLFLSCVLLFLRIFINLKCIMLVILTEVRLRAVKRPASFGTGLTDIVVFVQVTHHVVLKRISDEG